jgi:predicted enzyme related to lactoylglutathione lyase
MPNGLEGDYFAARLAGRSVAGIGQVPPSSPAVWSTYVCVDHVEQTLAQAEQAGGARLAGPFDVGSDGRLAMLADATGVPFSLWQAAGASAPRWSTSRTPGR